MNEEHPKLLEKEKSTILKYFPSYRPVWDRIVGNVPVKVKNDELYTYFAYVCMRDFADRYQTSGQYFFPCFARIYNPKKTSLKQRISTSLGVLLST
jgi:hypothetical protein